MNQLRSRVNSVCARFKGRTSLRSPSNLGLGLSWLIVVTLVLQPALSPFALAMDSSRARKSVSVAAARAAKPALTLQGSSIIVYGPERFDYQPGPTRNQYAQFAIPVSSPIAGTMHVQNGAIDGANRVTGATIQLNGEAVATARTLNLNTATLDVPASLQASNSLSVRVVGAPGSYLTLTILAKPIITALSPASAAFGATINIIGDYFDDSGPSQNAVRFTKLGGGTTIAQVNSATRTQLAVVVPLNAGTGPVAVETAAGLATSPGNFTSLINLPIIADFTPKVGAVGAQVALTGTDLKIGMQDPVVTFAAANNTRLPALVSSATPIEVMVTVPNAAVTGTIQLTNSAGLATSSSPFFVETTQDFQIASAPSTATTVQGSEAHYVISLTSEQQDFTQLASLTVVDAPPGSTVTFLPEQITSGASSTLSLRVAANLSPANYQFTIRATASIDGNQAVRTAPATVSVLTAGTTTLSGRVLSTKDEPIMGATVSLDGFTATTSAAGDFLLSGIAAGVDRPVMVDGRTASAPNRTYPVIAEPVTVVAGHVNVVPYIFHLPNIDTANEVVVMPNQTTMVTTPKVPGLSLMIPANAALTNRDGTPVTRASLTGVEIDRTPAPLPSNVGTSIVYTAQPGGALPAPGVNMPVTYPNLAGANPGTRVPLWNFNHDTVQWYIYGYGNVSADGRLIVPEAGVGLPDFSWHFPEVPPACDANCCKECPALCPRSGAPVELSSGVKLERTTDIAFGGARGGLELTRIYTSNLAGSCDNCPFGRGVTHNYAIRLAGTFNAGGAGRILHPEESSGRLFSFVNQEPSGILVFNTTATPHQLGDIIRKLGNGTFEYMGKSGAVMRFDAEGRLTATVDRNGNTTTLTYTGANLTQVTDPTGRTLTLQYAGTHVTSVTDPLNRVWQYGYDGGNRLVTVTDPLNKTLSYTHDFLSRITSITDKRGNVMKQVAFDGNGRVSQQQFADGGIETYSYTLAGSVVTSVSVTDPLGRTTSKRFNGAGQVIETTDALGQRAQITRDLTTNLPLESTGPCGCVEDERTYDSRGNPLTITDRLGQTTSYEYEPVFNNLTRMTDRLGRVTTYTYDARGNRVSMTNALNHTTLYTYDQFGQLTSSTNALGHATQSEYDSQGNVVAVVDPLGNRSTMEYDVVNRLRAMVDPLGRRSELTYNHLDRILTRKDPAAAVTTSSYDSNGNRIGVTDALNHQWVSTYDKKNRMIASIDPIMRVTKYNYDAGDELLQVVSPSKRKVSYTYDARGQRSTITDGIGGIVRSNYDNRGNLTALTDQRNNTTTFAYDVLFRLVTQTDPLGHKTRHAYDSEDNVTATVDRLGRSTVVGYDALNRRQRVTNVDATVDYTYDAAGRTTSITDTQGGTIDLRYDNVDRLLSEQTAQGVVSYTYNAASQRATMAAVSPPVVSYSYDIAGRLSSITQASETFTYAYDTLSRMQSLQRPNGVTTNYEYDNVNRLARLTHSGAMPTIEDFQYSYNADDEIVAITSLASGTLLMSAKTAIAADTANRIQQFGQASYSFDLEGRTTTKTDVQGTTTYNWDGRGRLTNVALPDGEIVSYSYDALDRRQSRTAGGLTTGFLYDGVDVVRDAVSDGVVVDYLNGWGIDQKLRQTSAGSSRYFLQDHLSSSAALTSGAGGVLERARYEVFGASENSTLTRYGFTGREPDGATGVTYYRARWQDPRQGRFITEDQSRLALGFNRYAYVGNSPMSRLDPLGLDFLDINLTVGAGIVNSVSLQVGPKGVYIVPGIGFGTAGLSAIAVKGDQTPGFQGSIQGGIGGWVGEATFYPDAGPPTYGVGLGSAGGSAQAQYGICLSCPRPIPQPSTRPCLPFFPPPVRPSTTGTMPWYTYMGFL